VHPHLTHGLWAQAFASVVASPSFNPFLLTPFFGRPHVYAKHKMRPIVTDVARLSRALCAMATTLLKDEESARDNHVLACDIAKYSPIYFTNRFSNKPLLILLLTVPTSPYSYATL